MSTPYIGEIRLFTYNFAPLGWQDCDGSLLAISEFDTLFALIGTTYGGDGQNTFAVPDLRGRIPVHQGTGPGLSPYTIGQNAGTETVTLSSTQIPTHTHTMTARTAAATTSTPGTTAALGAVSGETLYATDLTGTVAMQMAASSVSTAGGSQPHENTMPSLTLRYCISMFGIFPSQA